MSASLAGLTLCEAKFRYGKDSAAASVLDVEAEDAVEGRFSVTAFGEPGTPMAPGILFDEPCLGSCCLRS